VGGTSLRAPPNFPIGVRTALKTTTSRFVMGSKPFRVPFASSPGFDVARQTVQQNRFQLATMTEFRTALLLRLCRKQVGKPRINPASSRGCAP
jgi:hypothetical protein